MVFCFKVDAPIISGVLFKVDAPIISDVLFKVDARERLQYR